jgi:hypothetical protein
MNFTEQELKLIASALEADSQGRWGDRRQEQIDKLIAKLKKA